MKIEFSGIKKFSYDLIVLPYIYLKIFFSIIPNMGNIWGNYDNATREAKPNCFLLQKVWLGFSPPQLVSIVCPILLKINRIINHLEDFSKSLEKIFWLIFIENLQKNDLIKDYSFKFILWKRAKFVWQVIKIFLIVFVHILFALC